MALQSLEAPVRKLGSSYLTVKVWPGLRGHVCVPRPSRAAGA